MVWPGLGPPGSLDWGMSPGRVKPASRLMNMFLCLWLAKASLGPRLQPTHDGRSSISEASPSGHPSPAGGHRRNGLFVLPAPCRSLGQGPEEMAIFCLGGRVDSRGVQGTRGRAGMDCGRTPGWMRPLKDARGLALLCASVSPLEPGQVTLGFSDYFHSSCLQSGHSPLPLATGWGELRCHLPPGGGSLFQKSKMLDAGCRKAAMSCSGTRSRQ